MSALLSIDEHVRGPKASPEHRRIQRFHAIAQYRRRVGVNLALWQYLDLCDRIYAHVHGSGARGVSGPFQKSRYILTVGGSHVIAVWDVEQCQIVTFIPASSPWPRAEGSEW